MGTGDPGRPARRVRGMGTVDPGRHSRVRRGRGGWGGSLSARIGRTQPRAIGQSGRAARTLLSVKSCGQWYSEGWPCLLSPPPDRAEHTCSSTGKLAAAPRERAASSQRSNPIDLSRPSLPTTSRYPTHRSTAAVLPNLAPLPLYYFLPYADWHCQTCTAHAKPWRETVEAGGTTGLRLPNDQ